MNVPSNSPSDVIIYRLDVNNRICFVNDAWVAAAANFGFAGLGESVLGASLSQYIGSAEIAQLYHDLLIQIRSTGHQARFFYRCDCQEWLRDMEMKLYPLSDGSVEFHSAMISVRPVPQTACNEPADPPADFIRVCSWCRSAQTVSGWVRIGDAIAQLNLFRQPSVPFTTHGICPHCEEQVMADLDSN